MTALAAPAASKTDKRRAKPTQVALPSKPATRAISYGEAWRVFLTKPNAWLLITLFSVTTGLRLWLGGFSFWDPLILAAVIAYQPFQEWLIHVYILHFRPRKWGRFTIDFALAKRHRHHHMDPWDSDAVFTPHGTLWFAAVVHLIFWVSVMPNLGLAMMVLSAISGVGLYYEFHHYVFHTTYKPKTSFYKRMTRLHNLHHFKNEHYWFGVTMSHGDVVLGTLPKSPKDVPTSPTARDIGGIQAGHCTT